MTSVSGAVVWSATYSSFGEAAVDVELVENNLRFAGQYYDADTRLHYNYFRYYDPKTGRYLTPDPIGLAGGINLFTYAGSNPINAIDPFGLAYYMYGRGVSPVNGLEYPIESERAYNEIRGYYTNETIFHGAEFGEVVCWDEGNKRCCTRDKEGDASRHTTCQIKPLWWDAYSAWEQGSIRSLYSNVSYAVTQGASDAAYAFEQSLPAWEMAGKIGLAAHTGTAVKGAAIYGGVQFGAYVAPSAYTAVMTNPQQTIEFVQGLATPGPPPASPSGYLGGGVQFLIEKMID
jgi:RHS repeat-associated protein